MTNRQPDALTRIANLSPEKRALLESRLKGRHASAQSGAIPRRPTHDTTPLSSAQERLWFLDQYEPANPIYNRPLALRLAGSLDIVALEQSLSEIVRRHDILRTTFPSSAGQPRQVVTLPSFVALAVVPLPPHDEGQREIALRRYVNAEGARPFDLAHGPLWRALLLRLADDEHILLITLHHIISDGWSDGVLSRELGMLYNSFATGQPATLPDLPIQYADYAAWQRERLASGAFDEHLAYWWGHLAGAPTVLDLSTGRQRPPTQTFRGATYSTLLPTALLEALKWLSQDENATLYMTLLAAFQTLLHRYTGRDDLLIGSPIAGRTRVETEGLIGLFVNTLVLRGDLSGAPSFRELLARTRATTLAAYDHQEVPFEQIVTKLQPPRDRGRNPLVQVMFALQNTPRTDLQLAGLTAHPLRIDTGTAKFDLSLFVIETPEGARAAFEYNCGLFDAPTIERMAGHFHTLLEGVAADPDRSISALPLLTGAERHQLLVEWNDTRTDYPRDACVHELFAEQAARTPNAIAVVYEGERLTYRELDARANQLAHYLRRLGVGPDVLVGLCVERSVEMVVGLLGILKAGGAYLPLDPAYPKDRLAFMLEDTRVPVLLTQQRLRDQLPLHEARVLYLDVDWSVIAAETVEAPTNAATGDSVAYVIYTSGSTGMPKGTLITHSNVVRLFAATQAWFHFDGRDVWTLFHSFAFDFSVWELWGALLKWRGACAPPDRTCRCSRCSTRCVPVRSSRPGARSPRASGCARASRRGLPMAGSPIIARSCAPCRPARSSLTSWRARTRWDSGRCAALATTRRRPSRAYGRTRRRCGGCPNSARLTTTFQGPIRGRSRTSGRSATHWRPMAPTIHATDGDEWRPAASRYTAYRPTTLASWANGPRFSRPRAACAKASSKRRERDDSPPSIA